MTITVELPPETEKRVLERAAAAGTDVGTFIREAVEEKLQRSGPSFADILRPIHEEVCRSGLSEAELDELLNQSRELRQPLLHDPATLEGRLRSKEKRKEG